MHPGGAETHTFLTCARGTRCDGPHLRQMRVDALAYVNSVVVFRSRELDRWLTPYRQLWRSSLDALERHLDEGK